MGRIEGDLEKFASQALEPYLKEALKKVEESKEASLRLVEEAYKEALNAALRRLKARGEEAGEKLQGLKARYDLEVKTASENVKDKIITRLLSEALEEFRRRKAESDSYKSYLERVLRDAVEESKGGIDKIVCAPEDRDAVASILARLGVSGISIEANEGIYGGVILEVRGGARLDYTVNNIVSVEEPRLRRVARKTLFGE
ncbi:MAG: V-type ATP synthase subunit E [Aeropyrum sp.]|nr:V-type ATP synthase subunit E [Aeropyrum sp.]MCE4616687.1 V-type ATP synthase subunit E [Aeropyrum sp.]